jgi:hypothetical protein
MSNTQTNTSKNVNQSGVTNGEKQEQQKKAFEQGNGSNSTTAEASKTGDKKNNPQQQSLNNQSQSKITNQDDKTTNKDGSLTKKPTAQNEINDDEDVDENSQVEGYKEEQEIDTPVRKTEETENKIPKMNK